MKAAYKFIILLLIISSCKKDKDLPPYSFKFDTKINTIINESFVNEKQPIIYKINSKYLFEKIRMNLKLKSDKKGLFFVNDSLITQNTEILLNSKYDTVFYKGLEAGKHKLKFNFTNKKGEFNDRSIDLLFNKNIFNVSIIGETNDIIQGSKVKYLININDKSKEDDLYEIRFNSYDQSDLDFINSEIILNNSKVVLNKWYSIDNKLPLELFLMTKNYGSKTLNFSVKNNSNIEEFNINQNIIKRTFNISTIEGLNQEIEQGKDAKYLLKINDNSIDNNYSIKFSSYIINDSDFNKSYIKLNDNKIILNKWYKIEKERFEIITNSKFKGNHKLSYYIKNDFSREFFEINQNIDESFFDLTLTKLSNEVYQGQFSKFSGIINSEGNYKIKFISENNISTKIRLDSSSNLEFNKWYDINNPSNFNIYLSSDKEGDSEISYIIENNLGSQQKKSLIEYFKPYNFSFSVFNTNNNIFQGIENEYSIILNNYQNYENEKYYIIFKSYDSNIDSYVKFNNQKIIFNNKYEIKKGQSSIFLNSFNKGVKELTFEIINNFGKSKSYTIEQNVLSQNISLSEFNIIGDFVVNKTGNMVLKISNNLTNTDNLKYRIWTDKSNYLSINNTDITDNKGEWIDLKLFENSTNFILTFLNAGSINIKIQFKDKFENISEVFSKSINIDYDKAFNILTDDINWIYNYAPFKVGFTNFHRFTSIINISINENFKYKSSLIKAYFDNGDIIDFKPTLSSGKLSFFKEMTSNIEKYSCRKMVLTIVGEYKNGVEKIETYTKEF